MRYTIKQSLKRFAAASLAVVLCMSAVPPNDFTGVLEVFAYTASGLGTATGPTQPGPGAGGMHAVFLASIPETLGDDYGTKPEFQDKDGNPIPKVDAQIIENYRNKWDTSIINSENLAKAAYYFKEGFSTYSGGRSMCLYIDTCKGDPQLQMVSPVGGFDDMKGPMYNNVHTHYTDEYSTDLQTWRQTVDYINGGKSPGWPVAGDAEADKWIDLLMYKSLTPQAHYNGELPDNGGYIPYNAQVLMQYIICAYALNEGAHIPNVESNHDRYSIWTTEPPCANADALMETIYLAANIRLAEWQQQEQLLQQRELLKKYIMNMNQPGRGEFIVLVDVAFAGQNDGNVPMMYSYLAASNYAPGGLNIANINDMGSDRYSGYEGTIEDRAQAATQLERDDHAWQVQKGAGIFGAYKWAFHYLNSWDIGHYNDGGRKGLLKYTYGATKTYFSTPYGWESTIRNTDAKGRLWGMPGFGMFAARTTSSPPPPGHGCEDPPPCGTSITGCPPDDPECNKSSSFGGTITVTVDPRSKKVNVSEQQPCVENEQVTMTIKIAQRPNMSDINGPLSQAVKAGGGAEIVVFATATNEDHTTANEPGDPDFFNLEGQMPSDFIKKEKLSNNKYRLITRQVKSIDELKTLMNNISTISFIDNTITVCDKVTNRYYAKGYICIRGGSVHNDYFLEPKGTEVTDDFAWDEARLYGSIDPYYYSDMRHKPVSEIKANDPRNETYEAMAGVPTTTDLYLGAGATEYMVNVDLKYRKEKGVRDWIFKVTCNNCYANNKQCTWTCPGPQYDDKGNLTHPKHSQTCDYCTGSGCEHTQYVNQAHPGTCNYTWTIHQPIDEYAFMDITNAQLWLLDQFKYSGNNRLSNPSTHVFMPELGEYAFVTLDSEGTKDSAADWQSGGGRLQFNVSLPNNNAEHWSHTTKNLPSITISNKHSECSKQATNAINAVISTLTDTYCKVISDYVVVETSEGYQNVMYYEQESQHESLASYKCDFTNTKKKDTEATSNWPGEVTSDGLHFNEVKTQEDMWDNNGNSSSDWESTHPTTTGYNGEFSSPSTKYNNSNSTRSTNIAKQNVTWEQPNLNKIEGNTSFEKNYNSRYIETGFNIIDSTTPPPERKWSASDSVKPVTNGDWDTGHMKVLYKKVVEHKGTKGGKNFQKWTNWQEAPYSEDHDKINDIVIHNPISNRDATVISNDSQYDKRVYDDLDQIGTNKPEAGVCPNNEMCPYATLTCTQPVGVHVVGTCYTDTVVGKDCGMKPLNSHVHGVGSCTARHKWNWVGCSNHTGTATTDTKNPPPNSDSPGGCKVSGAHWEYVGLDLSGGWGPIETVKSGVISYNASGTDVYSFTATTAGKIRFYSTSYSEDPRGRIYINGSLVVDNDDGGSRLNFDTGWHAYSAGDTVRLNVHQYGTTGDGTCNIIVQRQSQKPACDGRPNVHVHVPTCKDRVNRVLKCSNPHHHFAGEPWDYNSQKNHYAFADLRCYTPCRDNSKHSQVSEIKLPNGDKQQQAGNIFINIDREFRIYYPDVGDFQQQPNLLGIAQNTDIKGKGYVNNCDTDKWLRNKFVKYQWNSIDEVNNLWLGGEYIDLLKLPGHKTTGANPDPAKIYKFECVLGNNESAMAEVVFLSIANNAPEQYCFDESTDHTNYERFSNNKARHTVRKKQFVDVVGYIGALTLHDVGDPRFAELFKKVETNPNRTGWLIPNVVRNVDYTKSNYIVADNIDVRYENARTSGFWHSVYGVTDRDTGGKNHEHKDLPLRPKDNPINELKTEAMRPGYLSYFDIETVGNYYGENTYYDQASSTLKHLSRNSDGSQVSYQYMMQIKPKYYELNLDTKQYKKVDVYEYSNSTYKPVCLWKGLYNPPQSYDSDYYLYFDWLTEQDRRNTTALEKLNSTAVQTYNIIDTPASGLGGAMKYVPVLPSNQRDPIGIKNALYLIDFDRTYIGSTKRYGRDMNLGNTITGASPGSRIPLERFYEQSQRWHFTLGVPSSSVFVYENQIPTDERIKDMKSHNAVIVCTIEIKVRGEVWTLQYDGSAINRVDGNGFKITEGGPEYPPPPDVPDDPNNPDDPGNPPGPNGEPPYDPEDPVVIIYENKKTAADDVQSVGTH